MHLFFSRLGASPGPLSLFYVAAKNWLFNSTGAVYAPQLKRKPSIVGCLHQF
jgi:hypothetical protein